MKSFSFDAKKAARETSKSRYQASNTAERNFARQLKKVARAAGTIIEHHTDGATVVDAAELTKALKAYAKTIEPWARRQAEKMLKQVSNANSRAYKKVSKSMANSLRQDVTLSANAFALMQEQTALITSIPLEAGLRAQRIAAENFIQGRRAVPDQSVIDELVEQMGMSTEVAVNRAKTIARTETARARAISVGSRQYMWRNSGDGAVRPSHEIYKGHKLDGMIFSWDNPPTLDDGMTGHPGTFPNCRCYAEPILPEE